MVIRIIKSKTNHQEGPSTPAQAPASTPVEPKEPVEVSTAPSAPPAHPPTPAVGALSGSVVSKFVYGDPRADGTVLACFVCGGLAFDPRCAEGGATGHACGGKFTRLDAHEAAYRRDYYADQYIKAVASMRPLPGLRNLALSDQDPGQSNPHVLPWLKGVVGSG